MTRRRTGKATSTPAPAPRHVPTPYERMEREIMEAAFAACDVRMAQTERTNVYPELWAMSGTDVARAGTYWVLPAWQRPFVWSAEQCLAFARTLYAGGDAGEMLLLRYDRAGARYYAVLDGQQRLATLGVPLWRATASDTHGWVSALPAHVPKLDARTGIWRQGADADETVYSITEGTIPTHATYYALACAPDMRSFVHTRRAHVAWTMREAETGGLSPHEMEAARVEMHLRNYQLVEAERLAERTRTQHGLLRARVFSVYHTATTTHLGAIAAHIQQVTANPEPWDHEDHRRLRRMLERTDMPIGVSEETLKALGDHVRANTAGSAGTEEG